MNSSFSVGRVAALALAVGTVYIFARAIYRLYIHPLSSFPGPRLAGATGLWKAYVQCTGSFLHDLIKLHEVYGMFKPYHSRQPFKPRCSPFPGPVIRIRPDEVSLFDCSSKMRLLPYLI